MPKRRTDHASKRVRKTAKGASATPAAEPKANGASLVKPESLGGRAGEIWDTYAPELAAAGMLTARDALALALWCQLGVKAEAGELTGALITQFRLLANDFGMTPSGKGRELTPGAPPAKPHKFFKD